MARQTIRHREIVRGSSRESEMPCDISHEPLIYQPGRLAELFKAARTSASVSVIFRASTRLQSSRRHPVAVLATFWPTFKPTLIKIPGMLVFA